MKLKISLCILAALSFFAISSPVSAHQPVYVAEQTQIAVENPDISQAFYGALPGEPATYTVSVPEPLSLYVGLLVPDQEGARTDFTVDIYDSQNGYMDTLKSDAWQKYFEEFARDDYLKGPEYKKDVPQGEYTLVVSNPQNQGKYVLVVGTKESFPLTDMPRIFDQLIKVKVHSFQKPWYSAFLNIFGVGIGIVLLLLLGIVIVVQQIVSRRTNKKKKA